MQSSLPLAAGVQVVDLCLTALAEASTPGYRGSYMPRAPADVDPVYQPPRPVTVVQRTKRHW